MKRLFHLIAIVCCSVSLTAQNNILPYKDANLPVDARVKDLLSRMTLEEKVAQLQCRWTEKADFLTEGHFDAAKARQVMPDGIGSLARMNEDLGPGHIPYFSTLHPREAANLYNDIQHYFVKQTRLGIPVLNHEEGLHGHQSMDATNFPMPIAMACSWDTTLIREVYTIVAKEIRVQGGGQVLAPVVDIVQDPRWGRTEETMGEDPWLTSRMGVVQVKAYQGHGNTIDSEHVAATLKHLGIHGRSEGGVNTAPSYVDERTARDFFFKPFTACIREAKPMNVMVSYPQLWGEPSHANKRLVTDILRHEWGFDGLVVSDYGGISGLVDADRMTPDYDQAGVLSLMAGVDVELPSIKSYKNLAESIDKGLIPESRIDEAVQRILEEKFRLGLFEHPYVNPDEAERVVGCQKHRDMAYRAATESMVLLQNKKDILPLDAAKTKCVALIGPNADKCVLGGYSSIPKQTVSLLQAMNERYGNALRILHATGVKLLQHTSDPTHLLRELTAKENAKLIEEAVAIAREADVVVLCLGENDTIHREATSAWTLGDLPTLELLGGQKELVDAIAALGKPTVAVVSSGTTLNLAPVAERVDALLQCWYLGQEGGYAIADALFGKVNPSGKLTISFPRSAGHIPAYYNHLPSSRRGYNLDDISPLYPFGFGLGYTTFGYSPLTISRDKMTAGDQTVVSVQVTNTGKREGTEIVQLYITDDYALLPRPVKELRGFERVRLQPGETKRVDFTIGRAELGYLNAQNEFIVEPGTFTIQVGASSVQGEKVTLTIE